MKQIILTTATCDNDYLDVLKAFLASIRLNSGYEGVIRADLINGNSEIYDRLKNIYSNLEINHIELDRRDWHKQENMIHVMRKRMSSQYKAFTDGYGQILTLDCDAIVRKPIEHIWDGVGPGVLKVWLRKKKRPQYRFQAGVMVYGNSQKMRKYYKHFLDSLGSEWGFFDGQQALYEIYLKHKDEIKLISLPMDFNDCLFKKDSFIWHAKVNHMKEEPFVSTMHKYLKIAEEYYEGS